MSDIEELPPGPRRDALLDAAYLQSLAQGHSPAFAAAQRDIAGSVCATCQGPLAVRRIVYFLMIYCPTCSPPEEMTS